MKITRKHGKILENAIQQWLESSIITPDESTRLKETIEIIPFDWKRLAKYSFWISIICLVTAVSSIFADQVLMELLEKIFNAPDTIKSLVQIIAASGLFYLAITTRARHPEKIFSSDALFFLGILFIAGSITYLGKALDTGSGHFSLLILLASLVYGLLGFLFRSAFVWSFSIISIGAWFGTETGYVSGWGAYYLGMNYPLRFVLFGSILVGLSFALKMNSRLTLFYKPTYILGLLYLFLALWILSIFGNYGEIDNWYRAHQYELFHWSILFGLVAAAGIAYGLKYDDSIARGFGITFLFINLYTRYFEYFWDSLHKAIFFLFLAISFWLLGRKAEEIWSLRILKHKEIQED
jgi:hypothetical protein